MTAFARFLGEKAERYIELRHSLGYAFSKQAGTLRAFVRYVERAQLDAPATRTMALDFALSFGGAANSRVTRHGVLRRFYEYLAVYDVRTEALERRAFPRSRAITPPRILTNAELASLIDACARISPSTPLRGRTMATLIGLLASSGCDRAKWSGLIVPTSIWPTGCSSFGRRSSARTVSFQFTRQPP